MTMMIDCGDTLFAHGVPYICRKFVGHPGRHEGIVLDSTWADGDTTPTPNG